MNPRAHALAGLPACPSVEELAWGRELLLAGLSFPQMRLRVVAQGASHEVGRLVVQELAREQAERGVVLQLSDDEIVRRLVERELDRREALVALQAARSRHARRLYRSGIADGRAYTAGCITLVAGSVLAGLNAVGAIDLAVESSTILMLGTALTTYGLWKSRRRVRS
jgi:hypothetical protein